ncbi:MAG TPA: LppX_LprAFG lipoprotein [Marmoricola sp.]|nr:LppX_LprAFG lipoprotein [Marmoricola sp.]
MPSTTAVARACAGVALAVLLLLSGCASTGSTGSAPTPHQVLLTAKKHLDEARSVHLVLSTRSTPTQGDAVLGADGVLTHQPAFKGSVKVLLGGFTADVPVVSVDGQVHAKLPLTPRYAVINPAEYGAPDPADFADPRHGISGLLLRLTHPRETGRTRDGSLVLTTYSGSVPGSRVRPIIPSADARGAYSTVVGIDSGGRLATLDVTGHFFAGSKQATYHLTFDSYGRPVRITAP